MFSENRAVVFSITPELEYISLTASALRETSEIQEERTERTFPGKLLGVEMASMSKWALAEDQYDSSPRRHSSIQEARNYETLEQD